MVGQWAVAFDNSCQKVQPQHPPPDSSTLVIFNLQNAAPGECQRQWWKEEDGEGTPFQGPWSNGCKAYVEQDWRLFCLEAKSWKNMKHESGNIPYLAVFDLEGWRPTAEGSGEEYLSLKDWTEPWQLLFAGRTFKCRGAPSLPDCQCPLETRLSGWRAKIKIEPLGARTYWENAVEEQTSPFTPL